MQDYKRAVVIGTSSLGKASMQVILPIDEENQQDFIKITIEKFYRVTGESCQIKGVVPDVFLPKLFDDILKRENAFETALKNEQITPNLRYRTCSFPNEVIVLENSKKRVAESESFKEILALNNDINTYFQNPKIEVPMVFDAIFKYIHSTDKIWETINKIEQKPTNIGVSNTTYETEILRHDVFQQRINTVKMAEIKNNPYVEEGFNILENINQLKN
jgi:carboxyl-terminal processing protease